MQNDFEMVVKKMDRDMSELHIYPLGDLHYESSLFDEGRWSRWKKQVSNDPLAMIAICGDIFNNDLKGSKGNSFETRMRISEAKVEITKDLRPLKDKILCGVAGNHEYRSVYAADDCPLMDVMCNLGLEDVYRENMCFAKVSLGARKADRQVTYTVVVGHGAGDKKCETFGYAIDGMDIFITGHTHHPMETFPAKIVIDPYNNKVKMAGYTHVTVPSFQKMGGYALRGMYMPHDNDKIPMLVLSGREKNVEVRWI